MPTLAITALGFARSHWKSILIALAFAALGFKLLTAQADANHWHSQSDRYEALYRAEQAAHKATVANYRAAAEKARADDQANARRVEHEQSKINQEASDDYQNRLAALRARYDAIRLRGTGGTASANPGTGGATQLSGTSQGTRGPDEAPGEEGLSLDDRFLCSSQAEQLDALIQWVSRQQAVDVNADTPPPG